MLLALWWYFWTLPTPIATGPDSVTVISQHFVVALVVAHAFAPPTARQQRLVAAADVAIHGEPEMGHGFTTHPGVSPPFGQPGFWQDGFAQ